MLRTKIVSLSLCIAAFGSLAMGCTSSEGIESGDSYAPNGSVNVSQGGAQDIAQFRAIVEAGNVPTLDTLDPVGFFAEHAIDLPDANCGQDVCFHPFLAVAPRFAGGNWTMAFVAMNTPVDPSELERPPVHLAIAIESSGFTDLKDSALDAGLESLRANLREEDRISVITFGDKATRHLLLAEPTSQDLSDLILQSSLVGDATKSVGLYDGIAATAKAFSDGDKAGFEGSHRVLLLTSGHATQGITDEEHILALGEGLVEQGTAFGVIGMGKEFESKIPSSLGSMGAGTYSYALNPIDMVGLLENEGKTTLYPLATELDLKILPSKGYKVGRIYGTKRATATSNGATLTMPALFIGQRDGASDVGGSRRGGGGGLFVELLLDPDAAKDVGDDAPAFQLIADYKATADGLPKNQDATMLNALPPGENPVGVWWNISDGGSGKQYMMLNMYLALRGILDFYQAGDCARALGLVDMMKDAVSPWLGKYSDSDITDDNNLMLKLRANVFTACEASQSPTEPKAPQDFNGGCASM